MQPDCRQTNNHVKNDFMRWVLIGCGWLSVCTGVIGIFLPLLPTVPFLLLAAACFAKSSERFHTWLLEHNSLGPLIRDYLNSGGMPLRAKRMAIGMVWVSFPVSAFVFVHVVWVKIGLLIMAACITGYLLSLPTTQPLNKRETDISD